MAVPSVLQCLRSTWCGYHFSIIPYENSHLKLIWRGSLWSGILVAMNSMCPNFLELTGTNGIRRHPVTWDPTGVPDVGNLKHSTGTWSHFSTIPPIKAAKSDAELIKFLFSWRTRPNAILGFLLFPFICSFVLLVFCFNYTTILGLYCSIYSFVSYILVIQSIFHRRICI